VLVLPSPWTLPIYFQDRFSLNVTIVTCHSYIKTRSLLFFLSCLPYLWHWGKTVFVLQPFNILNMYLV
jgi:hypothetical protein